MSISKDLQMASGLNGDPVDGCGEKVLSDGGDMEPDVATNVPGVIQ
jgi:hypothetical protein